MHINVFTECTPSPSFEGLWRYPAEPGPGAYRDLAHWAAIARRLEAACVDALFFADVHGVYDVYQGSWRTAVREAVQIPSIDPVLLIPALAAVTDRLGFAVTYSTTYHPPYLCARTFSTLDHLTRGRVAWNIVTSYLQSASRNGIGEHLTHDTRYDRADEYLAAVCALWEESWADGAITAGANGHGYADPDRVREIDHSGQWFQVRGPHQCEPSPQRTPVLYQAGASGRGLAFAARHAEVVFFMTIGDQKRAAAQVAELRRLAAEAGRDPDSVKVLLGIPVLVAPSREAATAKLELLNAQHSRQGQLARWCGWTGIDLAGYPDDTPIDDIKVSGTRTPLELMQRAEPERAWTVGELRRTLTTPLRPMRGRRMLFGTPSEVADQMAAWVERAGVDGFNLVPCPGFAGISDICDLLMPYLQGQGMVRDRYDPAEQTLRERYFGAGDRRYRAAAECAKASR